MKPEPLETEPPAVMFSVPLLVLPTESEPALVQGEVCVPGTLTTAPPSMVCE